MVKVDEERCRALAKLLSTMAIPEDEEDTELPSLDRSLLPNFLLMVVAICHQTTPAGGAPPLMGEIDGKVAAGWDYLLRRLAFLCAQDAGWASIEVWERMTGDLLRDALRDHRFGERLTDPEGRAALLRNLGSMMRRRNWIDAQDMFDACDGRIDGADPCLVQELARFKAYTDPVRKKTYFFLSLMRNFGIWRYADPENLGPPVDYHEVRGHLRIGTVVIEDDDLADRLRRRLPVSVEEDNAIRMCVVRAINLVAEVLGITPSQAHYLFWNCFRNICTRDAPQCLTVLDDNRLPDRYVPLTGLAASGRGCPFSLVCRSAAHAELQDPVVDTEFH